MAIALSGYSSAANLLLPQTQLSTSPSRPVIDNGNPSTPSQKTASEKKASDTSSNSGNQSSSDQAKVTATIEQLKARDREVRLHEMAHLAAAGGYATSSASYSYQVGPDGQRYAIGGEVGIDTSPVSGDPEATIQKAMTIQRAALAPANPSSQDYQVQAQAVQMEAQARTQLSSAKQSLSKGENYQSTVAAKPSDKIGEANPSLSAPGNLLGKKDSSEASAVNLLASARMDFELRLRLNSKSA